MALTALILLPLLGGLFAAAMPRQLAPSVAAIVSLVPIGYVAALIVRFDGGGGIQQYVDETWISQLGIHYALGIDGLNIFLIALAALAWPVATFFAGRTEVDRPGIYFALLGLAETATFGAFLAQDLALFVIFFDLLLVPFYLLIGMWGGGARRAATAKFMIYTLAGSLLMLAATVALGAGAADAAHSTDFNFTFVNLMQHPASESAQRWIFVGFALALLVKMPIFPLHGWMPDTYRATPLPVLIVLSAVVSKLGAYGFLRVVLPLMPQAVNSFQTVMLVLALIAIVYGSVMAFSQDETRLIVGYSSIAQLGFILLGIFSLDPKGAQGAILQMVNHGLVVIPLFVLIGILSERAGSERLGRMGGLAQRAPVLATMFLIVALATLAMPGSPNFVGELYILFGAFDESFVYGATATIGVALAAVYMIRFFQRAMHNGLADGAESREADSGELGLLLPAIVALVVLAVYPQPLVETIEPAARDIPLGAQLAESPHRQSLGIEERQSTVEQNERDELRPGGGDE